ncbi:MAG TPA: hypothetical protein VHF69_00850, partial [Candidatus Synoicihabitans sp.]|nr:hypothetical protein [Candidatus Synoicihabitans sp.]
MTLIDPSPAPIKLIAVLADLHAGSVVGLLPPGFVSDEGNEIAQNAPQRWLWTCWEDAKQFLFEVAGADPFAL